MLRRGSRADYSAAATTTAACGRELLDFTVGTIAPTAICAPESATGVLVPGDRLRIEDLARAGWRGRKAAGCSLLFLQADLPISGGFVRCVALTR